MSGRGSTTSLPRAPRGPKPHGHLDDMSTRPSAPGTAAATYIIRHDEGEARVRFDASTTTGGWERLGHYLFRTTNAGDVTLATSETPQGKPLIADSVRFVLGSP